MARSPLDLVILNPTTGNLVEDAAVTIQNRADATAAVVYTTESGSTEAAQPLLSSDVGRVDGWMNRGRYVAIIAVTGFPVTEAAFDISPSQDGSVTTEWLNDGAITGIKLATNAVTTIKINDDAVTSAKIAPGAVDSSELANDSVTNTKIASDAVDSTKLKDDVSTDSNRAVTTDHIRNGAVTTPKVADGNVTTAKVADGAITDAKVSNTAAIGKSKINVGSGWTNSEIANDAIDAAKIAPNAVGNSELADNAVGSPEIMTGAVGTAKLADASVSNSKIIDGSVTSPKVNLSGYEAFQSGTVGGNVAAQWLALVSVPNGIYVVSAGFELWMDTNTASGGIQCFINANGINYPQQMFPIGQAPSDRSGQIPASVTRILSITGGYVGLYYNGSNTGGTNLVAQNGWINALRIN
jgi:hypothetical protein